jgi:hypothetical protein
VQAAQRRAAVRAAGDLHQAVEQEEHAVERLAVCQTANGQLGGVGVVEGEAGNALFLGEVLCLFHQFGGEVEAGDVPVTLVPEADGHAAGAATGFEEAHRRVGKIFCDQRELGFPQPNEVRRPRVVQDGIDGVEVGTHGGAVDLGYFRRHIAMNMPFAFRSCGQRVCAESGSNSGCAAVNASATAVVSARVSVHTA